mgnify:CR=1 FL=1
MGGTGRFSCCMEYENKPGIDSTGTSVLPGEALQTVKTMGKRR